MYIVLSFACSKLTLSFCFDLTGFMIKFADKPAGHAPASYLPGKIEQVKWQDYKL